jgi:peptidylprolyl isomerase
MKKVENGSFVSVHYTGKLDDGQVFDSSEGRQPLEVEVGAGRVLKEFETALMGMAVNEKKAFTLAPEEAYGERRDDLNHTFARSELPDGADPKVGDVLSLTSSDGQQFPARVADADDEKIVIDLNHPLAGQSLTFDVEVVGISDTRTQSQTGCDCSSKNCDC